MKIVLTQVQQNDWINYIPNKIRVEKYPYSILKVIPYKTGYSAKDFEKILNTLSKYYNPFLKRFRIQDKVLIYTLNQSFCFEVLFQKDKVMYSFAIPKVYKSLFVNRIRFLLGNCDVSEVEDYLPKFKDSLKQTLGYEKNWFMALNTSDSVNINDSLLVLTKDLSMNDKVLLQHVLRPIPDFAWKNKWQQKYNHFSQFGTIHSINNLIEWLDFKIDRVLYYLDMFIDGMMCALFGESLELDQEMRKVNFVKELSEATKHKTVYDGFKVNINIFYKTESIITADNVSRNILTIMKDIEGDNLLALKKSKQTKKSDLDRVGGTNFTSIIKEAADVYRNSFILNTKEATQLIKLPSEKMLQQYEDVLDRISVADIEFPQELINGEGILLGELQQGSKFVPVTFGTHVDSNSKPLVYIATQEGGKSSYLRMYAIEALKQGHSIFAFDTIDGKTIQVIRDYLPDDFSEDKIIILDFRSNKYAFPLLWNEVFDDFTEKLNEVQDEFEKYQVMENFSDMIGSELIRFIDMFQAEDRQNRLTPNMRSYLVDLAQLVFMNGGNFGMVKDCLFSKELRHKLLANLKLPPHLPFYQNVLRIDNESESSSTLRGIETRLNLLMENATLKKYFSLQTEKKLDFAYWANNGYCVLIQIPEQFADPIITFLVQKLWLAIRTSRYEMVEEKRPLTHLLIDEPNRFPTIMNILNDYFIASRKWHLRFLFFIHNMSVFRGAMENLKAAGTSFIMLPTSHYNFSQVSEFFSPLTFDAMKEVEKLIVKSNGVRRFALVSLHYKNAWYPCIIKLPLPVEMRCKKYDRSYLNERCAKLYGVSQREYYKQMFEAKNNVCNFDDKDIKIDNVRINL